MLFVDGDLTRAGELGMTSVGRDAGCLEILDLALRDALEKLIGMRLQGRPVGARGFADPLAHQVISHGDGFRVGDEIFLRLATTQCASAAEGALIDDGNLPARLVQRRDGEESGSTGTDDNGVEVLEGAHESGGRLEIGEGRIAGSDASLDLLDGVARGDVLRTVPIDGLHGEGD